MDGTDLLQLFDDVGAAVAATVAGVRGRDRRARTSRPGQYAIDISADDAALNVLRRVPVRILSEESGVGGDTSDAATITVVIDPIDGSTNCSRGLPYWATACAAIDGDGLLAAMVVNQATGVRTTAVRGEGAFRDGVALQPSSVQRVQDSVLALDGMPAQRLPWKQFRALGSQALALCDVAAGVIEGYVGSGWTSPWDYLGGVLICREAGAVVVDASGHDLLDLDPSRRRQILAACTPELLDDMRPALS